MLYGLDPEATSRTIGWPHVQPAAFILGSNGEIAHAVYSSGKVGRLTVGDALTIVKELPE